MPLGTQRAWTYVRGRKPGPGHRPHLNAALVTENRAKRLSGSRGRIALSQFSSYLTQASARVVGSKGGLLCSSPTSANLECNLFNLCLFLPVRQ